MKTNRYYSIAAKLLALLLSLSLLVGCIPSFIRNPRASSKTEDSRKESDYDEPNTESASETQETSIASESTSETQETSPASESSSVSQGTVDTDDPTDGWQQAYIDYVEKLSIFPEGDNQQEDYSIADLNGDGIPEIIVYTHISLWGNMLLYYSEGEVHDMSISLGVDFNPETGVILFRDGRQGSYSESLMRFTGTGFERIASGKYYTDYPNSDEIVRFVLNDEEVSEEEYYAAIPRDKDEYVGFSNIFYGTKDELIEKIRAYYEKPGSSTVVAVDFQELYDGYGEGMLITAYNVSHDIIWQREKHSESGTEISAFSELGIHKNKYYIMEYHVLTCLDLQTGEVLWKCEEQEIYGAAAIWGDDDRIYLTGWYGPDFSIIRPDGTVEGTYEITGYYNFYKLYWEGDKIRLIFDCAESGYNYSTAILYDPETKNFIVDGVTYGEEKYLIRKEPEPLPEGMLSEGTVLNALDGSAVQGSFTVISRCSDVYGNTYQNALAGDVSDFDNVIGYNLQGNYQSFSGIVIRDSNANTAGLSNPSRSDIVVVIYGDGVELYRSVSVNLPNGEYQPFSVDVTGIKILHVSINGKNFIRLVNAVLN